MRGCEGPRAAGPSPARPAARCGVSRPLPDRYLPAPPAGTSLGRCRSGRQRRPPREGRREGGGAPDPQHPRPGALGAGGGGTALGQGAWVVPSFPPSFSPSFPRSLSPLTARKVWDNPPSPLPVRGRGRQCRCTHFNSRRRKFGPVSAGANALPISASAWREGQGEGNDRGKAGALRGTC